MTQLSKALLTLSNKAHTLMPLPQQFDTLPEKVMQFGTGVLLRGLPDYFINLANQHNVFNGRVVVVKSTRGSGPDAFAKQDNLYYHWIRGITKGQLVEELHLNGSISRVLNANTNWQQVLDAAVQPTMQLVISNTTEVGIVLTDDDIRHSPPVSFPGKLLACLYHRYEHMGHGSAPGLVIVPTELVPENGKLLKSICVDLAKYNNLDEAFVKWMVTANAFCDSLVDRIVPGQPKYEEAAALEQLIGCTDELSIVSEPYALWAIESDKDWVRQALSFEKVHSGVIIAQDIAKYRTLKLRLLNGTHTLVCGLAIGAGFSTVKQAMAHAPFKDYVRSLMLDEIVPVLVDDEITGEEATDFASQVIDRFCNPFIEHQWMSITMNYSSKMKMRCMPLIAAYFARHGQVPAKMALGLAAMLRFLKVAKTAGEKCYGTWHGQEYLLQDDNAHLFAQNAQHKDPCTAVGEILADTNLWGLNAAKFAGLPEAVANYLRYLENASKAEVAQLFLPHPQFQNA